mgnify:CR=1 FL=1|tara:strand:+ start:8564 stop:8935 length:372 start_codon:yes stop_codon:yes gene_type:complete
MKNNLVAVYGSLRKGLHNHGLIKESTLVGEGVVKGFGMHSLRHYPALTRVGRRSNVLVEVYEVDEKTMAGLDNLEGYPSYYTRKMCPINIMGETLPAWVYYMDERLDDKPFVEGGDWKEFLGV